MTQVIATLTVLFEEPFWVGIYERQEDGLYQVCKITFGSEPKDYEVHHFLLEHWPKLRLSPALVAVDGCRENGNPKRMQRLIQKQLRTKGVGTKAQIALGLQRERQKVQRRQVAKQRKEEADMRQFQLRQQKKKEKHKGH